MKKSEQIDCPLCFDKVDKLLFRFHFDDEKNVLHLIEENNPGWKGEDGICGRCVDYYHTALLTKQHVFPETGPHFPVKSADDFVVIPTGLRLNADPRYTGKGVTICFIDSGFYPHPDLVAYKNRILKMLDFSGDAIISSKDNEPDSSCWHGTMTTVVGAGDGYCSDGLYKGIASNAELVLLKVQNEAGKIPTENIVSALQWVAANHTRYNIRIVNMSIGGDEAVSIKDSQVDQLAEALISEGINIVAAVGNDINGVIKPPANALNVIAVGGADDNNQLKMPAGNLYHSTFGKTVDGLMKPELVAHAIWIAAPILPGTREKQEAEILYRLVNTPDQELLRTITEIDSKIIGDVCDLSNSDVTFIRDAICKRVQQTKFISANYMHVDGTSFAAPMVSAVIAQLLEANPALTPAMIRAVLFSTAKRMDGFPAERQGFGVVQPRKALLKVLCNEPVSKQHPSPFINKQKRSVEFSIQNNTATQIALTGDFNNWNPDNWLLQPGLNGIWKIEIPFPPPGKYAYKFFVDESRWLEDVDNPYREPDGFNGFNNIVIIE
ncbi:MAG: S8 family serine peptidase [Ferruginibacter sp.]